MSLTVIKPSSKPFRILVTRTDRLGDVMLATPVLKALKKTHPFAQISFLVQKQWMPVLQYGSEITLIEYDPKESASILAERLRKENFQRVIVLRDEKTVTKAVRLAKIPERVGPYSSFRSFFSFNRGKFQKRSACKMHEAEYNLNLVTQVRPARTVEELPSAWVETGPQAKARAENFLRSEGLLGQKFFVIHPGSSGSARYVKQTELHALARALLAEGKFVCVSGGPDEATLLDEFSSAVPEIKILGKEKAIGLDGMAEVYRKAEAVIAHGTGPLHLAAAVGAPVLAIFSPIFVLSEKRWGPLTPKRSVWTPPDVNCPAKFQCLGSRCAYFDCMDRFTVQGALC
jgi:ADP-heptose:LPS heptosyltransferase